MNITKKSGEVAVEELHNKSQVMLATELGIREGDLISQTDQETEKRSEKVAADYTKGSFYKTNVTALVEKQSAAFDLSNAN